jgi:hypothetical protein
MGSGSIGQAFSFLCMVSFTRLPISPHVSLGTGGWRLWKEKTFETLLGIKLQFFSIQPVVRSLYRAIPALNFHYNLMLTYSGIREILSYIKIPLFPTSNKLYVTVRLYVCVYEQFITFILQNAACNEFRQV